MRKELSLKNEVYVVTLDGIRGEEIFKEDVDKVRLLMPMLFLQSPTLINNTSWYVNTFLKKKYFSFGKNTIDNILKDRYVRLMAFSIQENKCGLLVQSLTDMAISVYMQRILTSYAKYYSAKTKKLGHVFAGPYNIKHITDESDLLQTIQDFHSNKSEWSSFIDYKNKNRWGDILYTDIIKSLNVKKNKA